MGMRRDARKHDTVAARQHEAVQTDVHAEHAEGDRVITVDGPGRVVAVHDGPYPGAEEYEIRLEGGLGGGTYTPGQITASSPVEASVGTAEATGQHLASDDYPELGTLLHDRPDPATLRYTAELASGGTPMTTHDSSGADGGLGDADEGQVMWNPGEYNDALYHPHDWRLAVYRHGARAFDHYHPDQVYLRFGHWPENERSSNNVTGYPEEGVSVYDLDHEGEPMDPDPGWERGHHEHDESCGDDCDIPEFDEDYGNDTGEEMRGRADRAKKNRRYGRDLASETGHLVKGDMIGIGHDGEPLLNNVRRVGDWIDHRHLFVPGASKHPLARDEDDEEYEPPEEQPTQHTARSINGTEIDNHGTAPHWLRATNPNRYDELSTEGQPDPDWIEDIDKRQQAMASHPDDEPHQDDEDEYDERGLCAYPHEGPCPTYDHGYDSHHEGSHHLAMPSKRYPEHPEGFNTTIEGNGYENFLRGRINNQVHGGIDYTAYDKYGSRIDASEDPEAVHALKVNMLHTDSRGGKGIASAMMDHLYTKHPNAWINHGYRTDQGLRWWNSYKEPEGHEGRNVHNAPPHLWEHAFDPYDVADDIQTNERHDPGHHSDHHDVDWALHGSYGGGRDDEDPYCETCDDYGHHEDDEYYHPHDEEDEEEEAPKHEPDPRKTELSHGIALHLSPSDHRYVHDPSIPSEARAHRLLDAIGRGNMESHRWFDHPFRADADASTVAGHLGTAGAQVPATKVTLTAHPFKHDEVHLRDDDGDEEPKFETDPTRGVAHFKTVDSPINFHLKGMTWSQYGQGRGSDGRGGESRHAFDKPEPVGMPLAQYNPTSVRDNSYDTPGDQIERRRMRQEHKERYAPRHSPLNPPGTGEQMQLFSSLPSITAHDEHENLGPTPSDRERLRQHMITDHGYTHDQLAGLPDPGQGDALEAEHELEHDELHDEGVGGGEFGSGERVGMPHVHREHEPEQRSGYAPFPDLPQSYHPAWGGSHNPYSSGEFVPAEADTELPLHMLSSLVSLASADPEFRFHVTAAWRDVQAKAKRIRSSGGVEITHADEGLVIGNVRGDHHVYETGLQRVVGKRQSVASYSCGCKWGAYHWGASDDLSRFAGRMCSHALALQYEAASRGMFGKDVEADDHRPKWVPSKVVVKYDIDTGRNIRARSSLNPPEQPALIVAAAAVHDDPAALAVLAAVNDLFGDSSGYTEPSLVSPMGPTVPWDHNESPASAGPLAAPEADNWGSIVAPNMFSRMGSAGPEATLHEEPEGALPETDGEDHTASLGDVNLTGGSGIGGAGDIEDMGDEALDPQDPSIQSQGAAAIVAEFQRSAAARTLMDGGRPGDTGRGDIAQAAQAYLAKTAANFSRAEQDALIHESPGTQASNTDRLDIAGTHYAELEAMDPQEDDALWLM